MEGAAPPVSEDGEGNIDIEILALICHELVHAMQIERVGGNTFLEVYAGAYAVLRKKGLGEDDAYRYHPYEIPAYALQDTIRSILGDEANLKQFKAICSACDDKDLFGLIKTNADAKGLAEKIRDEYRKHFIKAGKELQGRMSNP